jgi:uncharacterized sulfatase
MTTPLNFLLITSDQQRWDTLGSVNPAIRTPHLDALAGEGLLFERAYTVNPVCTPARCSILTGQYPTRHGCWHVGTALPEDYAPTVSAALSRAGYFTGLLGKAHFRPCHDPTSIEAPPRIHDDGFFRRWSGPYHGFEHVQLVIGHTSEPHGAGMHYGAWLKDHGVDIARHFGHHDYRGFGTWDLPAERHGSAWVAETTIDAIARAQRLGKPFFLWSSFQDPHSPYVVPEPWASMYEPEAMPAPPPMAVASAGKPPFYAALDGGRGYEEVLPELAERGWSDCRALPGMSAESIRKLYAAYYGMVSLMDHQIGRMVAALRERGLLERTVVVFTTDHGDYLGHHGLWGKGLPIYEDAHRLPFIVRMPGCTAAGSRSAALQSLVDIGPTLLDLAGAPIPAGMEGRSQAAAWRSGASVRDHAILEFRPCAGDFMQWTIADGRYKLAIYDGRSYGELYDLESDPGCERNLFARVECAPVERRLRERLAAHIAAARVGDRPRPRTAGA